MNLGAAEFVIVPVVATVILGLIARSLWVGSRRWNPMDWARAMNVELTPRNQQLVRSYLARTRVARLLGAVGGFLAPHVYLAIAHDALPVPFDWDVMDALIGYFVGAVLAEVTIKRPETEVPTASLQPRELGDYLPRILSRLLRATAAVGLTLVLLYRVLPAREPLGDELPPAFVIGPSMILIVVVVELFQRLIVGRPQPVVDEDVVAADDAIRSCSVHALAAAGIALELIMISVYLFGIGVESKVQLLRWTLPWVALACFVIALGSWGPVARPHPRNRARLPAGGPS